MCAYISRVPFTIFSASDLDLDCDRITNSTKSLISCIYFIDDPTLFHLISFNKKDFRRNLTKFDLPKRTTFSDIIEKYDMIEFLSRQLLPGSQQDDVVLQIIILVGVEADTCGAGQGNKWGRIPR